MELLEKRVADQIGDGHAIGVEDAAEEHDGVRRFLCQLAAHFDAVRDDRQAPAILEILRHEVGRRAGIQ